MVIGRAILRMSYSSHPEAEAEFNGPIDYYEARTLHAPLELGYGCVRLLGVGRGVPAVPHWGAMKRLPDPKLSLAGSDLTCRGGSRSSGVMSRLWGMRTVEPLDSQRGEDR